MISRARSKAQRAAVAKRKEAAARLNIRTRDLMDATAELVWAKHADPEYYESEFASAAYRRRVEAPAMYASRRRN